MNILKFLWKIERVGGYVVHHNLSLFWRYDVDIYLRLICLTPTLIYRFIKFSFMSIIL